MNDWLGLEGKHVLVCGFANKKSVAWHVATRLEEAGARVIHSVRTQARRAELAKLCPQAEIRVCDVEKQDEIERLAQDLPELAGFVHSIAFANYSNGPRPFHETAKEDLLRAFDVSCFSLVNLAHALKPRLSKDASVVTIGISTTRMAAENYGYMGPVKAALDSAVVFLAKSFSSDTRVRFNSVNPGLLKTSASAGIPGYLDSYLFAEQATLRKSALKTEEVADAVLFLLSPRSAGVNAQSLVLDAGMGSNFFDRGIVRRATRPEEGA
ncbi:MAG: SDR family oxidoreductase [Planctomycetes bacterium]|nr:SDR family oxidoreductase [Planctomycetota bacterium]